MYRPFLEPVDWDLQPYLVWCTANCWAFPVAESFERHPAAAVEACAAVLGSHRNEKRGAQATQTGDELLSHQANLSSRSIGVQFSSLLPVCHE